MAHQGVKLAFPVVCRQAAVAHDNLAMGEIIVYSGSILVIVFKVTEHRVTFQGGICTSHSFLSLCFCETSGKGTSMKGSSYRRRDYAFGQAMLTLRTTMGLMQAGVAEHLGVSRKAVGEWEGGLNYPKPEHLKAFIALAVGHQAFPAGREEEEIRAFWQASRQKMLLDTSAADRDVRGQSPGLENRGRDHRGALRRRDRSVPGAGRGGLWRCA